MFNRSFPGRCRCGRDGAGTGSTGDAEPPREARTFVLTGALRFACCHFTVATARSNLFSVPLLLHVCLLGDGGGNTPTHTQVHTDTHTHVHIRTGPHTCKHRDHTCTHTGTHTGTLTYTCVSTEGHTCAHVLAHRITHVQTCGHVHTCVRTHRDTQTESGGKKKGPGKDEPRQLTAGCAASRRPIPMTALTASPRVCQTQAYPHRGRVCFVVKIERLQTG